MKDPSPPPPPQPPYATVAPPLPCPEQEKLRCPRCESLNTKFCYYNNYNLLQPRHFCKACRRYWTKGGSLRNIPVGGASRKTSKRPSSSKKTPGGGSQMPEPMSPCMGSGLPPPMGGFASSSGAGGGDGGGGGDEFIKACWSGGESNVVWGDIANFTPTSTFQ